MSLTSFPAEHWSPSCTRWSASAASFMLHRHWLINHYCGQIVASNHVHTCKHCGYNKPDCCNLLKSKLYDLSLTLFNSTYVNSCSTILPKSSSVSLQKYFLYSSSINIKEPSQESSFTRATFIKINDTLFSWALDIRCTQYTNGAFRSKYTFYRDSSSRIGMYKNTHLIFSHNTTYQNNKVIDLYIIIYFCIINMQNYTRWTQFTVMKITIIISLIQDKVLFETIYS